MVFMESDTWRRYLDILSAPKAHFNTSFMSFTIIENTLIATFQRCSRPSINFLSTSFPVAHELFTCDPVEPLMVIFPVVPANWFEIGVFSTDPSDILRSKAKLRILSPEICKRVIFLGPNRGNRRSELIFEIVQRSSYFIMR
jgi:hypothetical protein